MHYFTRRKIAKAHLRGNSWRGVYMNRVWIFVIVVIILAGLYDSYQTDKAAEKITTIRLSCVTSPDCKTM